MGLFDSLFGTNTTGALNKATGTAMGYTQRVGSANEQALRGLNLDAQGALNTGATGARSAIDAGTAGAAGAVTNYGNQALGALTNGVNTAVGTVQGSNAQYAPYVQSGQDANSLYADALGLNGAQGNAAATGAFQTSPGYQFQVDQASDNAARHAASLGMAGSGNTLDAITRLGSNLANQEYGGFLDRLSGLSGQGLSAANAVSGNNAAAGGFQYGGGTTGAGILGQIGSGLGTIYGAQGTNTANIDTGLGTSLANSNDTLAGRLSQNSQWKANAVNGYSLADASAQDAATNANNGIFSKLIGQGVGLGLKAFAL